MIAEMQRVATTTPDPVALEGLDTAMGGQFAQTQATVSVRTGKLKASGNYVSGLSDERGDANTWRGQINYGNEEAWYAAIHFAKEGQDPFSQPGFVEGLRTIDEAILDAPHLRDHHG
ncbi:hypothetical protein GCM10027047_33190 [Rhodococcus aerolatus]